MFRPVGSLPPAVYWRRRVFVGASIAAVILVVLTVFVVIRPGSGNVANSEAVHSGASGGSSRPGGSPSPTPSTSASTSKPPSSPLVASSTNAAPPSSPTLPQPCLHAQLTIAAATLAPSFKVGTEPTLILEVTNNGPADCTQNLADSQVELRVYNGAARVWGSHDCQIQPGSDVKTLAVATTVGVQVVWSGLSSQPKCAGTRQRVGAGTYTLYAYLGGVQAVMAKFTLT